MTLLQSKCNMDLNNVPQQQTFEVKTPGGLKIICTKHIVYLEAAKKCTIVYYDDYNTIITYHMLKWYDMYLSEPGFFRCHNSYIVNCMFIDCYCNKTITLKNKKRIPLSRKRKWFFTENLKVYQAEL